MLISIVLMIETKGGGNEREGVRVDLEELPTIII